MGTAWAPQQARASLQETATSIADRGRRCDDVVPAARTDTAAGGALKRFAAGCTGRRQQHRQHRVHPLTHGLGALHFGATASTLAQSVVLGPSFVVRPWRVVPGARAGTGADQELGTTEGLGTKHEEPGTDCHTDANTAPARGEEENRALHQCDERIATPIPPPMAARVRRCPTVAPIHRTRASLGQTRGR